MNISDLNRLPGPVTIDTEDTMTETNTTDTTIAFSIINQPVNTGLVPTFERDCLILRENPFGQIPEGYANAKVKADQLGWFVRTAHDMQDNLALTREDAAMVERVRIREALVPYIKTLGWDTSDINDLLTHLGMTPLTRTFSVKVKFGDSGYYYSSKRTVLEFTFETDDMDADEDHIAALVSENLSFDDSELDVYAAFSLNARIGGSDLSEYGEVEISLDLSDYYENFDVEVTEV